MTTNSELATDVAGAGWLGCYLEYARSLTRAPAMYHIATGLTCLAVACGSKVSWRSYGGKETWPNLYAICLGGTGSGKTTSTNIGADLLRSSIPHSVIADDFTPESMVRELANQPSSLVYSEEFGTLLAASAKEYNGGMKEMLTALYDPRETFTRSRSGKDGVILTTVVRPSLSMLAGSTIDWLIHHLKEVDFNSGFMPRMLLFPQTDADFEPEPDVTMFGRRDENLYGALRKPLATVSNMDSAHVIFEDVSIRYLRSWADAQQGSAIIASNENMRGMVQRISATTFKIGALLAVSDYGARKQYVVTMPIAKRATTLVAWLVRNSVDLFDRHILFEQFEKDAQALLDWIPGEGVLRSELLKYSRKNVGEFERLLTTLEQRGDVERVRRPVAGSSATALFIQRIYTAVSRPSISDEVEEAEEIVTQEEL